MKDLNKRIMSLLLSGALVSSVGTMKANAVNTKNLSSNTYIEDTLLEENIMNGIYRVMVYGKPVYVYLNNSYQNKYLNKNEALFVGELNYENVYVYEKTIDNTNYIKGVTSLEDKTITVYALSGESYISGWKRINKDSISSKDKVATTIELGEFLLKQVDLSTYLNNMIGFANVDLNRDGKYDELLYLGNNKINNLMTKNDAIKWASSVYENYYVFKRTFYDVNNKKIKKTIYAIGEESFQDGWSKISKKDIPEDALVATNAEFYRTLAYLVEYNNLKVTDIDSLTNKTSLNYENINTVDNLYKVMVNEKPVYVYLNNSLKNDYLEKSDALYIGELIYENVYVYEKTVDNINYIKGVSPLSEKTITVYALSGESNVYGWTKIDKSYLAKNDKIATSIELGEFLLKQVDLSAYLYNMNGFAQVDLNKDGKYEEILYLGNNKYNDILSRNDAIKWAVNVYENYYMQMKVIPNPNDAKSKIAIYAISDKANVNGWTRVNKKDVPEEVLVSTNTELYDALISLNSNLNIDKIIDTKEEIKKPEENNKHEEIINSIDLDEYTYVYADKDIALNYGYTNYKDFCILSKIIKNEVVYTLSTEIVISKDGWAIIGNDDIPENAIVFLNLQDALNYEYLLNNNYIKSLRK